jgi:hypothetical protein
MACSESPDSLFNCQRPCAALFVCAERPSYSPRFAASMTFLRPSSTFFPPGKQPRGRLRERRGYLPSRPRAVNYFLHFVSGFFPSRTCLPAPSRREGLSTDSPRRRQLLFANSSRAFSPPPVRLRPVRGGGRIYLSATPASTPFSRFPQLSPGPPSGAPRRENPGWRPGPTPLLIKIKL